MKILILNWRCWKHPWAGGAERYLYEISKRLVKRGHEITWFVSSFDGAKEREFEDGIEIIRRGGKFSIYLHAFWYYLKELRKRNFDLVIEDINGVPFLTPLYVWKPKKMGIIHHLVGWKIFSKELKLYQAFIAWLAEKLIPIFYFHLPFITVSKSSKEELNKNFIKKVSIVQNGLDFKIKAKTQTRKFRKPIIIYLGRFKKYKRIYLLINAFRIVKKRIKDAELWLVGGGDWKFEGKVEGVKNFGKVDEKRKKELLTKAWVLVSPSIKEGWGINVIEANACGTPCIAYDVPGLRDSIVDGKTGLLVKENGNIEALANAIIKVLEDEKLRNKLSINALKWARRFSWDKSAKEFEKIIKMVSKGNIQKPLP
ncbi:MAG: glycosyltransferase family 4 protein [Candidatus Aenigmatarchaeota archaeon]